MDILTPKYGMWFTQSELHENETRIFSDKLYNPMPNCWVEVSNEYKEQWEREHPAEEPTDVPAE